MCSAARGASSPAETVARLLVVEVETVFFQCARAIHRSGLWQPPAPGAKNAVPSAGAILEALTESRVDGESYDRDLPARQRATLY